MAKAKPPTRRALNPWMTGGICASLSLAVHGGVLLWVHSQRAMLGRAHALVDSLPATIESTLVLAPPPAPTPAPTPPPVPTPPPTPEPAEDPPHETETQRPAPSDALLTPAMVADVLDTPRRNLPDARASTASTTTEITPIAPPASSGAALGAAPITFAGVAAERASTIVYVVDASGPMASSLPFVVDELSRSIESLAPTQQFQVILFRTPPTTKEAPDPASPAGYEMFTSHAGGLLPATRESKDRVRAWLTSVRPTGRSDPLPGLKAALAMRPSLVFLLSRSIKRSGPTKEWGAGATAILSTLNKLNPVDRVSGQRASVIKTIQFLDDDPSGVLRSIAGVHGDGAGSYRVLELAELTGPRVTSVDDAP
ncbi:MAG: hypothetical protein JNL50_06265 [Phycisphaerae bacterium]|nr:hypothetical protein [Phycisphaerae bacterium]